MTEAKLKKLSSDVTQLKRDVKSIRSTFAKMLKQLERTEVVAASAASASHEATKKLKALLKDPCITVPQSVARTVDAQTKTLNDVSKWLGTHGARITGLEDSVKKLEDELEQVGSVAHTAAQGVDELTPTGGTVTAKFELGGVDANGSPVDESKQMDLEEAIAKTEPVVAS